MIPITVVNVGAAEPLVTEVLRSGAIAQGKMVRRLEEGFAELVGTRHAIAVSNGTTALVATLQALDLPAGAEVITSPFTFVATLNAILEAGAVARFADIREDDFCVDPDAVEAAVTARTGALLPVHLYGQTADLGRLTELADRHGIALVEDAAQAIGADFAGRQAGSVGIGCFSLYATKNLTTAEGGMITCDDDELADRLRVLRNQGMRGKYEYETVGHNYRMTDLHAAVGIPQLASIAELTTARRANAAALSAGLAGTPGLALPATLPGRGHVWHQYTVRVTPDATVDRAELAAKLAERGVGTGIYYPRLVFDYPCYQRHPRVMAESMPVAEAIARQALSLPVHPALDKSDVDKIVHEVRDILGG
ncbi:dTDP-4-amino-4,6-dideoxygalactose transaminase [Tamaricihabitans halophyticus]|uniref:dTDP-4-amino-4,6-dideoxygalactose transaminase n=1 Tax=Tamaricihabitans halophyticus TaxID=1262583 RepID=A0A4R2R542_9PSEU|nr:DegT/DnrJ/EryC1/StrS family aminotransferase [Tamaricihabitans halophyticus]TCP57064.1 dTDP-4-amino-4,6-dideoxygalactose transaminase [Tamaricihabitans halophyticus]